MSEVIRVMKRVGTYGNYFRITERNQNLLRNGKMCEVDVEIVDGKMQEINVQTRDVTGSQKIAPIVAEILAMDKKRAILIAEVARRTGGEDALKIAGLEVPEQTIHTAANRKKENDAKQVAKTKANTKTANEARAAKVKEVSNAKSHKKAPAPEQVVFAPETQFDEDI